MIRSAESQGKTGQRRRAGEAATLLGGAARQRKDVEQRAGKGQEEAEKGHSSRRAARPHVHDAQHLSERLLHLLDHEPRHGGRLRAPQARRAREQRSQVSRNVAASRAPHTCRQGGERGTWMGHPDTCLVPAPHGQAAHARWRGRGREGKAKAKQSCQA